MRIRMLLAFALFLITASASSSPPVIDYQPQPQTVILYQQAAFGVIAHGALPLYYQWLKNGRLLPGATNDQITFAQAQFWNEASYSVIVSNNQGTVTSTNAGLLVNSPSPGDIDCSFNCGDFTTWAVLRLAVQSDGKILVSSNPSKSLARLSPDGAKDHTFANDLGGGAVTSVAVQADGKVLIAGGFNQINGANHTNIARLNLDGSLDTNCPSTRTAKRRKGHNRGSFQ